MLNKLPKLRNFLFAIEDNEDRYKLISDIIDEFERRILTSGVLKRLEVGLIHGDFNEQNILVGKENGELRVSAILDFGDVNFNCYLFELAITVTYMIIVTNDLDTGGHVLNGYKSVKRVTDEEQALLKVNYIELSNAFSVVLIVL